MAFDLRTQTAFLCALLFGSEWNWQQQRQKKSRTKPGESWQIKAIESDYFRRKTQNDGNNHQYGNGDIYVILIIMKRK